MRDGGLTRLVLADGTTLERPPESPLEMAARFAATGEREDEDDVDEIAEEERIAKSLKEEWSNFWGRTTAASGGFIPPFPGPDVASRFFRDRA